MKFWGWFKKLFSKQSTKSYVEKEMEKLNITSNIEAVPDLKQPPELKPLIPKRIIPREKINSLQLCDLAKYQGVFYRIICFGEETVTLNNRNSDIFHVIRYEDIEDIEYLHPLPEDTRTQGE